MATSGLPKLKVTRLGASPLVVRLPNFLSRRSKAGLVELQRGRMAISGLPRMQAGLGASPLVVRLPNFRTRRRTASLWKLQRGRMATSGLLSFMATRLGEIGRAHV